MNKNYTAAEIALFLKIAKTEYDVVRLVDPYNRMILDNDKFIPTGEICHDIWGRCERCENCTSVRALQYHRNAYKIEFVKDKVFFIVSRYLEMEGRPLVMELVADATGDFIVNTDQKDEVARFIISHNDMLITDSLTKLYNRRFLDEHFVPSLRCCLPLGTLVNIAILDIDHFKAVNDKYGHLAGDQVLKDVAGFWKLHFDSRENGKENIVIRYGGDEMLILNCGLTGAEFEKKIQRHDQEMRKVCYCERAVHFNFDLSYGIASSEEMSKTWKWEYLFKLADQRLYTAKKNKKLKI